MDDNVSVSINAYVTDDDPFKVTIQRSVDDLKYLFMRFWEQLLAQLEN